MTPTLVVLLPILAILYRAAYRDKVVRFLFLYMCAKFFIDIFMWIAASNKQPNLYLENIEWIIRFYLLSRMLYEIFELKFNKTTVIYGAAIYSFVLGIDLIEHGIAKSLSYIAVVEASIMLTLCCAYLFEVMKLMNVPWLPGHRPFYIVAAVLFYFAGTIFLRPLAPYLNVHPYNINMETLYLMPFFVETASWLVVSVGFVVNNR